MKQLPPARRVVVQTEDPARDSLNIVLARTVHIDGREMLVPRGARVDTTAGGDEPLVVSFSFYASEVLYTHEAELYAGQRKELHHLIADALFDGALVDGATTRPLLHEEATNLAGYVVDIIGDQADSILDAYYSKTVS